MYKSIGLKVTGVQKMHCTSCEQRVTRVLEGLNGVSQVRADAASQCIDILFDPDELEESVIAIRLDMLGYATEPTVRTVKSSDRADAQKLKKAR